MSMQTTYPIFESGQVLMSSHLNSLVNYLEQQDRLTRNKLIGIGVVCGLEVGYEAQPNQIRISAGCAVTSQGYLIVLDESLLSQFRDYTVPVPKKEEAPEDDQEGPYPFFLNADGNQVELWELLPTDFSPAPGEPAPGQISAGFLNDKVVLLFLECVPESLKNCDVNDCSDKGAQMNFKVRILLIGRQDARNILKQEEAIAQRPVDRNNHPRYALEELQLEKINPSLHEIDNFSELLFRIITLAADVAPKLTAGLKDGYDAYSYLLKDLYPGAQFPNGPFGNAGYFDNVVSNLFGNLFLAQYFYDYVYDVVQSHNEFLREACQLEAECCPHPDRFPKHVLLGEAAARKPAAFSIAFNQPSDLISFDPLAAQSGFGPQTRPLPFRHHFIPSGLFDRQQERLHTVLSLHYRTYLLAYRFQTEGRMLSDLRITPSRDGDYSLSSKAIPFYYSFKAGDDLHRNWSHDKTVKNRLGRVFSHQSIDFINHPLRNKMEDHNFYRVEGHVGKNLRAVMQELLKQKRELGLTFGIEPVYIGLTLKDDLESLALNQQASLRARQAILKLLLCRMRDLDVVFLVLMAALFYYLFQVIRLLSRTNTSVLAGLAAGNTEAAEATPLKFRVRSAIDRQQTESFLKQIRPTTYRLGKATEDQTREKDPKLSLGGLYLKIKDAPTTSNLFDRTVDFARTLDPNGDPRVLAGKIYPSVSLLDKTEQLVEVVSAPSLADFDFDRFQERYDGFSESFESFAAATTAPGATTGGTAPAAITRNNQLLLDNFGAVAATGPQTLVSNLATELRERVAKIFSELLLGGYAKRHPGMEHKAGVPVGGTLILLYTHKAFLVDVLSRNKETVDSTFRDASSRFGAFGANAATKAANSVFAAAPPASDPLDDFVVLADFCLPHMCCDTDCSDIDLQPSKVKPDPARVKGTVSGRFPARGGVTVRVLPNAEVAVTSPQTQRSIPVEIDRGEYSFTAPPGTYKIEATAQRFTGQTRTVTLAAGASTTEDFTLDPAPVG